MSYHAINAATPLPSKIRAVQFFDRTGKQCDLLFGVHIYERATTACKNRPVRCGRSVRWILPSGEQTTATSFPGSVSYPALSLSLSPSLSLATLGRVGENPGDEAADLCRLALTRGSTIITVKPGQAFPSLTN